jgi:hypothetical protein
MTGTYSVDAVIRATLREEIAGQEPSASVRESLLATVERENVRRSALGPAIPPLVAELQEDHEQMPDVVQPGMNTIPMGHRHVLLLAVPLYAAR